MAVRRAGGAKDARTPLRVKPIRSSTVKPSRLAMAYSRPHRSLRRPHRREGAIFRLGECRGHAAALNRLCAERPDGRRLDAKVRPGEPLQNHHISATQRELDRQQPDRAGADNHDIELLVHQLWLHRVRHTNTDQPLEHRRH